MPSRLPLRVVLIVILVINAMSIVHVVVEHFRRPVNGKWIIQADDARPYYDPQGPTTRPVFYMTSRPPEPTIPTRPDLTPMLGPAIVNLLLALLALVYLRRYGVPTARPSEARVS